MTGNHDKLRSLFLVAIMVLSVFGTSIAFSGSAAAANTEAEVTSAIAYDDDDNGGDTVVQVLLDQATDGTEQVEVDGPSNLEVDSGPNTGPGTNALEVTLNRTVQGNEDVTIDVLNDTGAAIEEEVDVTITTQTLYASGSPDYEEIINAAEIYEGEIVAIQESAGTGADVRIREAGSSQNILDGSISEHGDVMAWETEGHDTDTTYEVEFPDTTQGPSGDTMYYNLSDLRLSATAQSNSLWNDQNITVDVSAVRGSNTNSDAGITAAVLDEDDEEVTSTDDALDNQGDAEIDLGNVSAGNYTVEVTDHDTGITAETDAIEVADRGDADVTFSDRVVTENRGDIASITLDFDNVENATLTIGNNDTVHYTTVANVTAPSQNSNVTLDFNSYVAGTTYDGNETLIHGNKWLSTDTEDAEVEVQTQMGEFTVNNTDPANSNDPDDVTLEASTEYSMNVSAGHNHYNNSDEWHNPADVGTLNLVAEETTGLSSHVAPQGTEYEDAGDVWSAIANDELTERDEIAVEDTAVLQLEASGLEGAIDWRNDNATDAFLNAGNDTLEHTNSGINAGERDMRLHYSNFTVTPDADNDTYFLAIDTANANTAPDRNYSAWYGGLGVGSSANDWFRTVERDAELDTEEIEDEDWVVVQPSEGQEMTGETNIAPGSEVTAYAQSRASTSPFLITPTATVQADGSFNATTDEFADRAVGIEFDASVRQNNNVIGDEYDGVIDEAPTPTPDPTTDPPDTDTPEPTTEPPTDTAEPTDPDTPEPTPTDEEGPGFGIAVSLIALIGAALLAARRYN